MDCGQLYLKWVSARNNDVALWVEVKSLNYVNVHHAILESFQIVDFSYDDHWSMDHCWLDMMVNLLVHSTYIDIYISYIYILYLCF